MKIEKPGYPQQKSDGSSLRAQLINMDKLIRFYGTSTKKPPEGGLSIYPRKHFAVLGGTANPNHVLVNEIRVR